MNCKKVVDTKEININKKWQGDTLISDAKFINSINSTCKLNSPFFGRTETRIKEDNTRCALSKIKFDYEKLNTIKTKTSIGNISSSVEIFIKMTEPNNIENADLYNQATLYVEKNKKMIDSIVIYRSINFSEALVVKERKYFLSYDKIYLLDTVEDESGTIVDKWSLFKINESGKIILLEEKEIPAIVIENIEKNNWKGEYNFEAKNKDDIKTTFNIKINTLNDIEIIINDDGTISKYTNINGQEVNNNKIKIVYNNSEDEMGIIFLEKVKNGYLISGNPIYFINPGSNEMPIQKK